LKSSRSEKYFKSVIGRDTILIALEDSRVIGYIQISDIRYKVEGVEVSEGDQAIHSIYVDTEHQGKGVGRALMDAAFNHPRIRGAEKIFIDVYEENTRALKFYKKYGFTPVGRIDVEIDGVVIGYDLVLMKKSE
jgi:ribosomal protein S18 acetylase RimI-like enzyme